MSPQHYRLNFEGYWRESKIQSIPDYSGIYCVYASTFNQKANSVSLRKLLYIGESEKVATRIKNHEKWSAWRKQLQYGEQICFSYAPIITGRVRVEAAMIYKHKPPVNTEYVNQFPFDRTTISTAGANALLASYFTVERSLFGSFTMQLNFMV